MSKPARKTRAKARRPKRPVRPARAAARQCLDAPRCLAGYDPRRFDGEFYYDAAEAERAVRFFPRFLVHIKGALAGKPLTLEPWQADILRTLFGWRRPDGTRRYRTAFIEVPRKNGKSTFAAGIALFCLFCDREQGAEIYSAASDRDQASLVFNVAAAMVRKNAKLKGRCKILDSVKRIVLGDSFYRAIAANAAGSHGYNSHCVVYDELHAAANRELYDVLKTSMGARPQPLFVIITTAGFDRKSICYEQYDYACKVRDAVIDDPTFLPVIYEAEDDDDWTDPKIWRKANPNLGVSISEDFLASECRTALQLPSYANTFRRLYLNQWTESDVRWLSLEAWNRCGGKLPDLAGRECWGGLDLSSTTDLASLLLVFPLMEEGKLVRLAIKAFAWCPRERAVEREKRDRVPYTQWIRDTHLRATEGDVIDYDVIRRDINQLGEIYNIREIGVDRWNAQQIVTQLAGDGFNMVMVGQGFASMSGPSKELEKLIIGGQLLHDGDPVTRWAAMNVSIESDAAGNIKPSKAKSTERIDPIVALVMAVGRYTVGEQDAGSPYDERGPIGL